MTSKKGRLQGLDALRGLAAIAVVLHHYTARYTHVTRLDLPVSFSLPSGSYGVQLFFIISGYVIYMTLERTPNAYGFLASRFSRLWPTFAACVGVTLAVLAWARPPWHPFPGAGLIVKNLTMMPKYFGGEFLDASYWSLLYEILFYVLAGIAFYGLRTRRPEWLCLMWMGLALLFERLSFTPFKVQTAFTPAHVPLFVMGILLYRRRNGHRSHVWFVAFAAALAICAFRRPWAIEPMHPVAYVAMVATFSAMVWWGTADTVPPRWLAPLVFLGDLSYPLYLVHQEVGYVVITKLRGLGLGPNASVLLAVAAAVLLARAISKLIEKPGQRALRRLFERLRPRFASERPPRVQADVS